VKLLECVTCGTVVLGVGAGDSLRPLPNRCPQCAGTTFRRFDTGETVEGGDPSRFDDRSGD